MKNILLLSFILIANQHLFSQNVGIGITTPEFKLDVRTGSINTDSVYRIGGNTVLSVKGLENTFVGIGSGNANNYAGYFNSAYGYRALYSNTIGTSNTANGTEALYYNTVGNHNTAFGAFALHDNIGGQVNIAMGPSALQLNQYGDYNIAIGYLALYETNSNYNIGIGYDALGNLNQGSYNTGIGTYALTNTSNAQFNVAVGYGAGRGWGNGWNNTIIGADADVSFAGQYNSIAIGNLAAAPDNSTVRIGNSANWSYGGYANWTNISDGQFKKNVIENVAGLEFIMKLRPVTYQMKAWELHKKLNPGLKNEWDEYMKTAFDEKEAMVWTGFIAQEVEAAAKETGFDFSGVDKPRREHGMYGLRYAEFVVPLVKAVQEQQLTIQQLKKEIEELKRSSKR